MRAKKESATVTVRMDINIYRRLVAYCEASGQSKTVAVERAVSSYIDSYEAMMKKLSETNDQ